MRTNLHLYPIPKVNGCKVLFRRELVGMALLLEDERTIPIIELLRCERTERWCADTLPVPVSVIAYVYAAQSMGGESACRPGLLPGDC
jgi:hypothetical protein